MKIVVFNGSPKGDFSITLQYVKYIQKHFQDHEFTVLNVAREIRTIKNNPEHLQQIIDTIVSADGILWAFPLYFLCVPGQYKQFIELLFEQQLIAVFHDKYTAVLTTSIHFYDNFAADYIHGICDDLKMKYTGEFLAEMSDLKLPERRQQLLAFAEYFLYAIQERLSPPVYYAPLPIRTFDYQPEPLEPVSKDESKQVIVLSDIIDEDCNLTRMIDVFVHSLPYQVNVFHLREIGRKAGCVACLHRGCDNDCEYIEAFKRFYDKYLLTADAVVYAGSIKDRYLSALWKLFFDRTFVYGHTPTLTGKPISFLLTGPLNQVSNLRETLKAYAQLTSQSSVVDIITDEYDSSETLTSILQGGAKKLAWTIAHKGKVPVNFYGYAGQLVFKDFVHLAHGIFVPEYRYGNIHNFYDFPRRSMRKQFLNQALGVLNKIPALRRRIGGTMKESMLKGLQQIIEDAES